MGGRGGSSGGSSAGGVSKSSVMTQSGQMADLGGASLRYGDKDPAVSGDLRTAVERQEARRVNNKIEYGATYDADGGLIGSEHKGGRNGVSVPARDVDAATVYTHNHPRGAGEEGAIGGTFSEADLDVWSRRGVNTFRATAAEGTYSITKESNFNAAGLRSYYSQIHTDANARRVQANNALADQVRNGSITYQQYLTQHTANFNRMLCECHDGLLAGQSKYGYHYTLEER